MWIERQQPANDKPPAVETVVDFSSCKVVASSRASFTKINHAAADIPPLSMRSPSSRPCQTRRKKERNPPIRHVNPRSGPDLGNAPGQVSNHTTTSFAMPIKHPFQQTERREARQLVIPRHIETSAAD